MPIINIRKTENGVSEDIYNFLIPSYATQEKAQGTLKKIQESFSNLIKEHNNDVSSIELNQALNKGHYEKSGVSIDIIIEKKDNKQ